MSASLTTRHLRLVANALHDRRDHPGVVRPIDTGDTEADGGRTDVAVADGLLHDAMEHLLDLELADRLEVRPRTACFGDQDAVVVGELAHRLGAAGVKA